MVAHRICSFDCSNGRLPVNFLHRFWAVHLPTETLRRDDLGWFRSLDLVSCSSIHLPSSYRATQAHTRLQRGAGLMLRFDHDTHPAVIAVCVGIVGVGIGFTFQPTVVALQAHCTKSQRAIAISNRNFFRCMGGACGLAISAAILQATLRSHLPSEFAYLTNSTYTLPSRSSLTDEQWAQILLAYANASHGVFILQVPIIGTCFLACVFVRDRGLERPKEPEEIEEEKRKAQAEKDAEAALSEAQPQEHDSSRTNEATEDRPSMFVLAESSMTPSRAEPQRMSLEKKADG